MQSKTELISDYNLKRFSFHYFLLNAFILILSTLAASRALCFIISNPPSSAPRFIYALLFQVTHTHIHFIIIFCCCYNTNFLCFTC